MKYDEREEKEIERKEKLRRELTHEIYKDYETKLTRTKVLVGIALCIIATIIIYTVPKWPSFMFEMKRNLVSILIVCVIPACTILLYTESFLLDIIFDLVYHNKCEKAEAKLYPPTKYEIEKKKEEDRKRKEEFKRDQEKRKREWEEERRRKAENRQREKEYAKEYHEQHKSDPATINRCQNLLKLIECFDDNYYMSVDPTIRMCWREIKFNMVRERNFANMYCDELEEHLLNNYVDTLITKPMGYEWVMTHKKQF